MEFEAAGAQWAVEHTKLYIRGSDKPTTRVVDHKPLIGLFKKDLADLSDRMFAI